FHQMDGAIMGDGLNTRHLMGFLTGFYRKLGMSEVKLWPSYFPYTEPSLQVVGYSDLAKDWIELGGSGVFRPEVPWPLGVKKPVISASSTNTPAVKKHSGIAAALIRLLDGESRLPRYEASSSGIAVLVD